MDRHGGQVVDPQRGGRPVSSLDASKANDRFEFFLNASTLKTIFGSYRHICELLHLKPNTINAFYPRLKSHLTSWRAKALWKKFDARFNSKCYGKGKLCANTRVLVIGGGPCGLRTAIEAQLLGAKVVVVEKRDRISRNNVLHLWPFVIDDLRLLGAKKFFGKFCAGSIDHISIRQLQCILLKVALLLGVEIHTEVSFEDLVEPNVEEKTGWRANLKPANHPANQFEFDVVIGADGKRNTLQGFKRKEFRGKLAIAITANFINKHTEAEARVEEISGVAFIFNQKFFKDLYAETGIDLENIVYYKDETHYFVMTAKKHSLIDKGVIKQDLPDTAKLLAPDNVDRVALMDYAREAAEFSTNYNMLDLEFAVNHYGQPDVAMFDFTSMYQAENASKITERHGYKLMSILVGDSLLEPFWPTGSGCARGFLSSLDAGWAIRGLGSGLLTPLEVLAERESIYRLLPQTTPENLNRDYKSYTLDPSTRYPNLNKNLLLPQQVLSLYDSDRPESIELTRTVLPSSNVLEQPKKRKKRDSHVDPDTLLSWIKHQVKEHEDLLVENITTSLKDGRILCAVISHYRPDLLDYTTIAADDAAKNNQLAFDLLEKEIGIPPVMTGKEMAESTEPDFLAMVSYLTQIYDTFRCEIPHIKHPKLKPSTKPVRKPRIRPKAVPSLTRLCLHCTSKTYAIANRFNARVCTDSWTVPMRNIEERNSEWIDKSYDQASGDNSNVGSYQKNEGAISEKPRLDAAPVDKNELLNFSKELQQKIDKKFVSQIALEIYTCDKQTVINNVDVATEIMIEQSHKEAQTDFIDTPTCLDDNQESSRNSKKCAGNENDKDLSVVIEDDAGIQKIRYNALTNCVYIILPRLVQQFKAGLGYSSRLSNDKVKLKALKTDLAVNQSKICPKLKEKEVVFLKRYVPPLKMSRCESKDVVHPEQTFDRVINWISTSNFEGEIPESLRDNNSLAYLDGLTDITSVTQQKPKSVKLLADGSQANLVKPVYGGGKSESNESILKFLESVKKVEQPAEASKLMHATPTKLYEKRINSRTESGGGFFSVIIENEENELSESKRQEVPFTKYHPALHKHTLSANATTSNVQTGSGAATVPSVAAHHRPSGKHKRHLEHMSSPAAKQLASQDRKPRKKRTMEKFVGTSVDPENRPPLTQLRGEKDEDFQARIKGMEDKWHENIVTDKKPKDLLRAIGKIDNTDWNIKEIEKKIIENKLGKNVNKDKEKVPKWSKEQFQARQLKMEKQHLERQDSAGAKFAEIDKNIKQLDMKLKEGSALEQNQRKVAQLQEKLAPKEQESKTIQKSNSKAMVFPAQGNSEVCHFCDKRVYLMERLSAEGRFFHRGCFRCQYCQTALRLGSYMFDRDGKYGFRFFCTQHFGMSGERKTTTKVVRRQSQKQEPRSPEKKLLSGVSGVDLLDRVQTPERIEFDLSVGHASSDHDEPLSQMDEDEWTDRNFGASTAEFGSSESESSSLSESESDDEDPFEEAMEEPPTKEGTLKWFGRYKEHYRMHKEHDDSDSDSYTSYDSSYHENSSGEEEFNDTATEGEEEIQAREQRKLEALVQPPIPQVDTGTDTEIASDDLSSSSEIQNSATEISTDSEFAHDDPTPTCEVPSITFNDAFVRKTRGKYVPPQKVQVKSSEIQKPVLRAPASSGKGVDVKVSPLVQAPIVRKPPAQLLLRTEGYALNRTQSTGGIATKVSLELKKKYLLGENNSSNSIQKSDSASTLDSKLRSFNSTITDCQKLLKPSTEISASMQTFCNKLNEQREQRTSPLSPLSSFQKNNIFKIPEKEQEVKLAKTPEKNTIDEKENEKVVQSVVANESEGRPRSPVHETSIVVPQINWKQQSKPTISTSETESSSSTSSSTESEVNSGVQKSASVRAFENIPKVNILSADDEDKEENLDILDSLKYDKIGYSKLETQPNSITEPPKSIASEKKSLNQPKCLPKLEDNAILQQVHSVLHSRKAKPEECAEKSSGHSTPSHESHDQITAVLTETELSDWARDAMVSDDFEESDYEIRDKKMSTKKTLPEGIVFKKLTAPVSNAKSNNNKVCEEDKVECINSVLNPHLDNLVFMDTGSESSSDEVVEVKNNGYVQFHDEEPEDSLSPVVPIVQTTNPNMRKACFDEDLDDASTPTKNTGYCIIGDKNPYGGEVIDLKPIDLAKLKEKQSLCENEEDSLIIVEQNEPSTTEENTCSESTVKNVTQVVPTKKESPTVENNNTMDKKRLEDKLAQVKKDMKKLSEQRKAAQVEEQNMRNNIEFEQHCQRLQSRVDFGNAKDSIDIRKLRRQSKSGSPPKPDLIQDEKDIATSPTRTKKEQIDMERDLNKRLIQEMVMNKMRAENKSLERKRRTRNSFSPNLSPSRPLELSKSPTTDIASHMSKNAPDVLLSTMSVPVQKSQTVSDFHRVTPRRYTPLSGNGRPMSVVLPSRTSDNKLPDTPLTNPEAFSLPDIQKAVAGDMDTPKAPPRVKNVEALKLVEKLKEDARAKAKLLSDVDLGLSPEEKLAQLRKRLNMKRGKENENSTDVHIRDSIESLVINTDRRNSLLYKNDTLSKKKNGSFRRSKSGEDHLNLKTEGRERTKSVGEVCRKLSIKLTEGSGKGGKTSDKCFKSDPNLLLDSSPVEVKKREKKSKDRERRKSITKLFTDLFAKKKEFNVHAATSSGTNKGFLSRISPKGKDKAKDVIKEEPVRRMSYSETRRYVPGNASPPPVPPLPLNYTGTKSMDESSDGEGDWKKDRSSCDTLDQSGIPEGSISSSRRSSRTARKARESQYKRHRMAQEVQRKLEETDVKTRELEQRGVDVEKALRGEADSSKDEADLLKEWFDLMKDLSELRRYERELLVRAQELELEDRYARLQLELKERLDSDGQKTKEDVQKEGNIIQEMMDLAAKRDALLASLEQDKLRFKEEDKGFEEQMLAKGISMTSPLKVTSK